MKKSLLLIPLLVALLAACSPQTGGIAAARTAAAQTLDAQLALAQAEQIIKTAEAEELRLEDEVNAQETSNAALGIELEETQSAQSTFAATEKKLLAPSGASCRFGPNGAFFRVAEISAGESVSILARSSDGEWWQVLSPNSEEEHCWVFWASDLSFEGDVFSLALVEGPSLPTNTPAPTRAPRIVLRFAIENTCEGSKFAIIEIRNTGPETYESAIVRLVDVASGTQLASSDGNNEFLVSSNSCPKGNSSLGPGQSAFLAIRLAGAKNGDMLRVSVRACTENGFGGNCISSNTQFTN